MKLFLISQDQNSAYNTYASAVVAAPDEETARNMNPKSGWPINWAEEISTWATGPEYVVVWYLGEAQYGTVQGVICTLKKINDRHRTHLGCASAVDRAN